MHIEKNMFDNIVNIVMNIQGKTKDTSKSREELNQFCNRPELKVNELTGEYPKACYMLDNDEKKILCKWLEKLRFPDGSTSNMSRCVNSRTLQMLGMKSHDYHVMMQRILPIAFRELLPSNVWKAITELCLFFEELIASNIKREDICHLNQNIPVILCKLEHSSLQVFLTPWSTCPYIWLKKLGLQVQFNIGGYTHLNGTYAS